MAWRAGVLLAVAVAYGMRFLSSWAATTLAADRRFDPHGFGLLGDLVLLGVLAVPGAGLLGWTLWRGLAWRGLTWRGLGAPASGPGWTAISVAILLVFGAPLPGQVWALRLLPLGESWPVALVVLGWFVLVAVLRGAAVRPGLGYGSRAILD